MLGQKKPEGPTFEGVAIMAGGNAVFQITLDPDKLDKMTDAQVSRLARKARRLIFEFATGNSPGENRD